jgi:hypothetical protein
MSNIIRLAREEDKFDIQKFIKENWRSDHIFVVNDLFFRYEMCTNDVPNFVISKNAGIIIGILGFIYNRDKLVDSDIFLVMFSVLKVDGSSTLGIEILKFVQGLTRHGVHTVGANAKVLRYYRFLGFKTGYLEHYYWLSSKRSIRNDFLIDRQNLDTNFTDNFIKEKSQAIKISRKDVDTMINNIDLDNPHALIKSKKFFLKRYLHHPIYSYDFFSVPCYDGILAVREVNVKNHQAWRIVDFYGHIKNLPLLCREVIRLAESKSIAFVDMYVSGIRVDELLNSGFLRISDNVIIPNYLEPLVMKNITISYVTSYPYEPILFRGDCDQDRPSVI